MEHRIVLIVLISFFLASTAYAEGSDRQNCLCACIAPRGGQFSCGYNTEDTGWSPSCRDISNGPCICKAFGCFRGQPASDGDCYDKCLEEHPKTMREKISDLKKGVDDLVGRVTGRSIGQADDGVTATTATTQTTTLKSITTTTLGFIMKGGRPHHRKIGNAEPPTMDCPGGQWMLIDTEWQSIQRRKGYVAKGYENYTAPPQPNGFFSGIWHTVKGLYTIAKSEFTGISYDGRYEDESCTYIADHTFQCSTKLDLVKSINQMKTVDHEACKNYA
ncbi:hypothetical protein ACFLRF_04640 [Candidatus Altiarchaeota archaeon]